MNDSIDRVEIEQILHRERSARDTQRWDDLAACYSPDASIGTSWFSGDGADFAKGSEEMAEKLLSFHEVLATVSEIRGDRAITETGTVIHLIADIDGVEVDCAAYTRSRSRLERKAGTWLILSRDAIYVRSWMHPTDPSRVPRLDQQRLATYRPSYRFLSYMLVARGLPGRDDLAGIDRPDSVSALVDRDEAWLAQA